MHRVTVNALVVYIRTLRMGVEYSEVSSGKRDVLRLQTYIWASLR